MKSFLQKKNNKVAPLPEGNPGSKTQNDAAGADFHDSHPPANTSTQNLQSDPRNEQLFTENQTASQEKLNAMEGQHLLQSERNR